MISRDDAWKRFVENYEIEVPETLVENELQYIMLDLQHRMRYDTLTGGRAHPFPQMELEEQMEDLRAAAFYEVKSGLVMKIMLETHPFPVMEAELEAAVTEMAKRQDTTVELINNFFGDDLSWLEQDVKQQKVIDWVWEQAQ